MPRRGMLRSSSEPLPWRVAFPPPYFTPGGRRLAYPLKGLCFTVKGALARCEEPIVPAGLPWAARRLGLPCTVRVPEGAVGRKVEAIHAEGADVSPISRSDLIDAHEKETWQSWPSVFLHPFAHPATVAGQGTIGREIVDDFSEVRTVLVPVGGGGLAAGIGTAVKGLVPRAQVFGVQAEGAAPLPVALRTRQSHRIDRPRTIADGIGIGIILPPMAGSLGRVLDGALVVTDAEIRDAMRRLALEAKIVAEPAGVAAFAAWIRYRDQLRPPIVAVVSGGNVDPNLLAEVVKG